MLKIIILLLLSLLYYTESGVYRERCSYLEVYYSAYIYARYKVYYIIQRRARERRRYHRRRQYNFPREPFVTGSRSTTAPSIPDDRRPLTFSRPLSSCPRTAIIYIHNIYYIRIEVLTHAHGVYIHTGH